MALADVITSFHRAKYRKYFAPNRLYGTGEINTVGQVDTYWLVSYDGIFYQKAVTVYPYSTWFVPGTGKWIGNTSGVTANHVYYKQAFTLDTNIDLYVEFYSESHVEKVIINGVNNNVGSNGPDVWASISLVTSHLPVNGAKSGYNEIVFKVRNTNGISGLYLTPYFET